MRVLVVTTWFPSPERPGVAPFSVAHAKAIARNHDVHVVHAVRNGTAGPVTGEYCGLTVTRLPFNPKRPLAALRSLRALRRLAAGRDVVHSMAFSSILVLAPLYPAVSRKWVHTEHWSALNTASPGRAVAIARRLLRLPRRVTAVSTAFCELLRPFVRHGAIDVVPNVVADDFECAPQPDWEPLKLVAVGGMIPGKRPGLAVRTLAELVRSGTRARLTWVGDGALRDDTAKQAADAGIGDLVELTGVVPLHQVAEYMRAANLFLLPTRGETFLVSAAEALACGRPVVLPALGSLDYVTADNGVLVTDDDDPAAYAAAVRVAADRFAGVPAEKIRATVLPRFGEAEIAARFDDLYRHLQPTGS